MSIDDQPISSYMLYADAPRSVRQELRVQTYTLPRAARAAIRKRFRDAYIRQDDVGRLSVAYYRACDNTDQVIGWINAYWVDSHRPGHRESTR